MSCIFLEFLQRIFCILISAVIRGSKVHGMLLGQDPIFMVVSIALPFALCSTFSLSRSKASFSCSGLSLSVG